MKANRKLYNFDEELYTILVTHVGNVQSRGVIESGGLGLGEKTNSNQSILIGLDSKNFNQTELTKFGLVWFRWSGHFFYFQKKIQLTNILKKF